MQAPKPRSGSLEVPQRTSKRPARKQKIPGTDSDSAPFPANRMPKDCSSKTRGSPPSPGSEQKKRPGKISDLESQLAQLQEELKKAKDQLSSSESWKKRAQLDCEETKKQLAAMSAKLEESQQQVLELSASEDTRIQELRKISQDRDRAWEFELEAVNKHHSMDSAALASAMNENQKLKMKLERVAESEAAYARRAESAQAEVQSLREELIETHCLVDNLKSQLNECKESEAQALEVVRKSETELAMAKSAEETSRSEGLKAIEAYNSMAMELEESKNQVIFLEGRVRELQSNIKVSREWEESNQVESELTLVKSEVGRLKSALEAAERRYHDEYILSTLQIRSAYELVERTKSESCRREAELEAKFLTAKADVAEFKSKRIDTETKFPTISEENQSAVRESEIERKLKKSEEYLVELKARLLEKDEQLHNITEENETLKLELEKNKVNGETLALSEIARAAEREARVTEQRDAAQAANSDMEAELRRLKVQSDQWRKAAEAAAAILSTGNNGKFAERTGSFDNSYHTIGGKLSSHFSENMDDDSLKNTNGNMLKKIGVFLKKGQN